MRLPGSSMSKYVFYGTRNVVRRLKVAKQPCRGPVVPTSLPLEVAWKSWCRIQVGPDRTRSKGRAVPQDSTGHCGLAYRRTSLSELLSRSFQL